MLLKLGVILTSMLAVTQLAGAQEQGLAAGSLSKRFTLEGGINLMAPSGRFGSFESGTTNGGFIGLQDLNFDDIAVTPMLLARWRATDRLHFGALFQSASIDGAISDSRPINFPPISIPAGYAVESTFEADRYRLSAGYAFWKKPNYEYGFGLELNRFEFSTQVTGSVSLGNLVGQQTSKTKDRFGVPALFAFGSHAVSDRVSLEGRLAYIRGELDDIDGGFLSTELKANYHIDDHWAVSGGLQYIDADFIIRSGRRDLVYDLGFGGLFMLAVYNF